MSLNTFGDLVLFINKIKEPLKLSGSNFSFIIKNILEIVTKLHLKP